MAWPGYLSLYLEMVIDVHIVANVRKLWTTKCEKAQTIGGLGFSLT
jgi:hypothetical protein